MQGEISQRTKFQQSSAPANSGLEGKVKETERDGGRVRIKTRSHVIFTAFHRHVSHIFTKHRTPLEAFKQRQVMDEGNVAYTWAQAWVLLLWRVVVIAYSAR